MKFVKSSITHNIDRFCWNLVRGTLWVREAGLGWREGRPQVAMHR